MKKILLLTGLAVVLTSFLINSSASPTPGIVQIYPNPVTDRILYISSDYTIVKVEIMDITGSSVFIQKYEKETRKVIINLDNLNRGLYIIQVKLDNNSARTEKIMIE
jgi:hypothetical protein